MGKELTKEDIAKISTKPKGTFQKDNSVKEIMELVSQETSGPVDKLTLREGRMRSAMSVASRIQPIP